MNLHRTQTLTADDPPIVSVVVPVYNEEAAIVPFLAQVVPILDRLGEAWEIVFADDGSSDGTHTAILNAREGDRRVKLIELSRNFGKEAAMTAGLDHARGEAIVIMDVDLQDPPDLIAAMVSKWRQGGQVVYARRVDRASDGRVKRFTAGWFYALFNMISDRAIPANVGDFRLMDRRVVEAVRALPERVRFMKGLFSWVGFRAEAVDYERPARGAGSTKFNYWKLWNFAIDGITSFSTFPLRMWSYFGFAIAFFSFLYGAFIMARTLIQGVDVPGYASMMTVMMFLGGVQLVGLGVLGEYLGRVYSEVKGRPHYVAAGLHGLGEQPHQPSRLFLPAE